MKVSNPRLSLETLKYSISLQDLAAQNSLFVGD